MIEYKDQPIRWYKLTHIAETADRPPSVKYIYGYQLLDSTTEDKVRKQSRLKR